MAVPIRTDASAVEPSTPIPLFEVRVPASIGPGFRQQFDVTSDGQRFLVNTVVDEDAEAPITLVVKWLAGRTRHGN